MFISRSVSKNVTHCREQLCLDSYRQRQIIQSDCLTLHNHAIKIDFDVKSHAQKVNFKVETNHAS